MRAMEAPADAHFQLVAGVDGPKIKQPDVADFRPVAVFKELDVVVEVGRRGLEDDHRHVMPLLVVHRRIHVEVAALGNRSRPGTGRNQR